MAITLWGHPISNNTRKIQWALRELDLPYSFQTVDLLRGEQKEPHILQLNPNGRVPILRDDDVTLWESQAILLHLAEKTGRLWPAGARDQAAARQWLFWVAADLQGALQRPWYAKLLASFGQALDEAAHAAQVTAAAAPLSVLNQALAGRDHLVGDGFSVVDIAALEPIDLAGLAAIPLDPYPHVLRWRARLHERPAFVATRPPA
jgi:glutathione S-transferase